MKKEVIFLIIMLISRTLAFADDSDNINIYQNSLQEITFDYSDSTYALNSSIKNEASSNRIKIQLKDATVDTLNDTLNSFNLETQKYLNIVIQNTNKIEQDKVYLLFNNPIHIPGISKTISLLCRIYSSDESFVFADVKISAIITDYQGIEYYIPIGSLSSELFHEYTGAIPTFIRQVGYNNSNTIGITLKGFVFHVYPESETIIDISLMNIVSVTDVFTLNYNDPDYIQRGW